MRQLDDCPADVIAFVAGGDRIQPRQIQTAAVVSKRFGFEVEERAKEEPTGDEQHQRHGDLDDDQRLGRPASAAATGA